MDIQMRKNELDTKYRATELRTGLQLVTQVKGSTGTLKGGHRQESVLWHCSHHKSEAKASVTDRAEVCCVPSCQRDFCLTSKQLLVSLLQYTTDDENSPYFAIHKYSKRDFEGVF